MPRASRTSSETLQRLMDLARAYSSIYRFRHHGTARRHDLPGTLIVSLTSYPARFAVVGYTIRSLLNQTIKPDRTILWVGEQDRASVPADVEALTRFGLEIRTCADILSFKKIIPVLEQWPNSFVVTADDDLYYEPRWLEDLVAGFAPSAPAIVCRRAHLPTRRPDGRMGPYLEWTSEVIVRDSELPLFPTGVGGVLYFPGSLSPLVTTRALFTALCPRADDVWLYWMGRMAGSRYRQVGGPFEQITWPRSQATSLTVQNVNGGENDRQISAMEERFGIY